jgi:hypothetical protein
MIERMPVLDYNFPTDSHIQSWTFKDDSICLKLYDSNGKEITHLNKIELVELNLDDAELWVCYYNRDHKDPCCCNCSHILIQLAVKRLLES